MRRQLLWGGLLLTVLAEGADSLAFQVPDWFGLTEQGTYWLSSGPRPARPTFVLASVGVSVASIAACVAVTAPRPRAGWVVYLTATGQMAFTLYLAHTVAIVIPQYHELLLTASLVTALGHATVFSLLGVAGSVWWRSRFPHGPIEGLIRQVTGRTTPAPWGGVRLSDLPPAPTPAARPRARSVSP
jgi:uncharacterized membrane protein YeiB